ncbi:MAG TPA: hypothetical protein EYP60_01780 [bacterium (Candidatus Stahlbacteria)]|nr:hypothetical protein [Candidatus Stahlbacteria bacterium]
MSVKWYSGYKGGERPISFDLKGEEYIIDYILRKEIVEDYKTKERRTCFWVKTDKGVYKLIHDEVTGKTAIEKLAEVR